MPKVLIADDLSPMAVDIFKNYGIETDVKIGMNEEQLKSCIGEYDGLAVRSATKATIGVLEKANKLKVIGRAGIGVDNIDIKGATAKGVVVMNTPFGNSITTAEHTIAMIFAIARQIPAASASTHAGKWEKNKFMGAELTNKKLGVIGCGNIGSIVADRALGLKMKVIAYDPFLTLERAAETGIIKVELDELIAESDFITLHTPLNDATRNILDKTRLAKTKKGVYIINCARGGLVDEVALHEMILSGHVKGAALDVFAVEPAKENILFGLEQVVLTPHLGASTVEAQENVALQVAEQISKYLLTGEIINAVNIPSISAQDAQKLKPYVRLAENLGNFAGYIIASGIKSIKIEYEGLVSRLNTKQISAILLKSMLEKLVDNINIVNAFSVAKEKGINVSEVIHDKDGDYQTLVKFTVDTDNGEYSFAGTLFGGNKPRLVLVNGIKLEASLSGNMLYINNEDKPGLIADLGRILAHANINIANFHLGRDDKKISAMALLEVDSQIPSSILNEISKLNSVKVAKVMSF